MKMETHHPVTDIDSSRDKPLQLNRSGGTSATSARAVSGCVAIIGLDGAGKTTIAELLLESADRPLKYLYMGTAIGSSNYALPTSRLLHILRERKSKKRPAEERQKLRPLERLNTRSRASAVFVLLHRLCEEWYRQIVSWIFQLRGFLVLYDRHFIFECAPNAGTDPKQRRLSDRIHFWLLWHAYPRPRLIFFLDAPPEVLFERKPEATLEYLAARRRTYLNLGKQMPNFVRVDATQPVEQVLREIKSRIDRVQENAA